jgi:histidinol-phosphatase (PHP family)
VIDYHVHSVHSGDARAGIREMCLRAVEIGLTEIAFTEHIDFAPTKWSNTGFNYKTWRDEISSARDEFSRQLTIWAAAEVEYQSKYHDQVAAFLENHSFDFIMGSAHYVGDVIMEEHERYFTGKSQKDAYIPYFEAAADAVETGFFDVLAHPDLCKRHGFLYYGPFVVEDFRPELERLLSAVIRHGMVIEINTSGLRQSPKETYPGIEMLKLYKELGGKHVSVGSDAHRVEQLGAGLDVAMGMAGETGLVLKKLGTSTWPPISNT